MYYLGIFIIALVFLLTNIFRVLKEYERAVIFRLGRIYKAKGPGLIILIPGVDRMVKISLRTLVMDVPPQDVITRDNVSIKVNAVVYFRVINPEKAVIEVEDYVYATSQLSQTTLRSVLGQVELDDVLAHRDKINSELQGILDRHTDPWGIKVANVEVKHVDLPQEMQRAMARQAEAERERRAKIIAAEGEFQAAAKLGEAADIIDAHPSALQLRYLQTLAEIATENNSTTIFPIPIDLLRAIRGKDATVPKAAGDAELKKKGDFELTAPALDTESLAAEIKRVEEKRARGVYDRYDLSGIASLDYEKDLSEEDFLRYHLNVVARLSDVNYGDFEIASKGGTAGRAGVFLKKIIWKLLRFYTYRLFSQQREFDCQVSEALLSHYRWSRREIDTLTREVDSLRQELSGKKKQ